MHIGKSMHFRKAGIPIPSNVVTNDFQVLEAALAEFKPKQCVFLGDLFHSDYNNEFLLLKSLIQKHHTIKFILVKGNHDIVEDETILNLGILEIHQTLNAAPFQFTHHPKIDADLYNIAGHLHPGYRLKGKGRQGISLPVFYFGKNNAILPAFSAFSGKALIKPQKNDILFGIANNNVMLIEF